MRHWERLPPPSWLTLVSLTVLSLLAMWPFLNLTYVIVRYGTELTPEGAGYNFPPEACFPPSILLSVLGPWAMISRLRIVSIALLAIVGLAVATSLLLVVSVLADLATAPELASMSDLSALPFAIGLVLLAMPVARGAFSKPDAA